jgi:hypothetical protein
LGPSTPKFPQHKKQPPDVITLILFPEDGLLIPHTGTPTGRPVSLSFFSVTYIILRLNPEVKYPINLKKRSIKLI